MTNASTSTPRNLKPAELAAVIRSFREIRQWSQETLAALTGLSVRTIQRIERGEASGTDARRALARAFEFPDIDIFNQPFAIPTKEELKAQQEEFDREHMLLDAILIETGQEIALLFACSNMHVASVANPSIPLSESAANDFASLVDYLNDYRDIVSTCTNVENLDVYKDLQSYMDALRDQQIVVVCAVRDTKIVGVNWIDKTPWPVRLIYITASTTIQSPPKIAVPRKIQLGL